MASHKRPPSYYSAVKTVDRDAGESYDSEDREVAVYNATTEEQQDNQEPEKVPLPKREKEVNFRVLGVRRGPETETFRRRCSQKVDVARARSAKFRERILAAAPDCCKRNFHILFYALVGVIVLLSLVVIGLGIDMKERCPAEPRMPVYLIVTGFFGLVFSVPNMGTMIVNGTLAHFLFQGILFVLKICWLIGGSAWLAKATQSQALCDSIVISLAVGTVIVSWLIVSCVCFVVVASLVYIRFKL